MMPKFSLLFVFLIFITPCFSQDREIFVPETELGALFEGATDRVLIKRNEFETLRQQVRELKKESEQDKEKPPVETVFLSSDYRAEIIDSRTVIDGIIEIDVLTDQPVTVPLPLEHVAVLEAILETTTEESAKPATLFDHVQKTLILPGKQRSRIRLRMTTPLEIDATRQRLQFHLPYGTKTTFQLSVPGDVELKSGAAVLSRKVENGTTHFNLLLPPGNNVTEILMTLNSHRVGTYSAVLVRSVQFAEVTEQYERLHATVSLSEFHQGVRETSFFVPTGFEITEVRSVFLDRWNVQKSDDADKRDVLTIRFREQIPGLTTIYLSAMKSEKTNTAWHFPSFEPVDTVTHSAVLGLLLDQDLEMFNVETNNIFPINTLSLKEAIPPSAFESLPGSPTLRLVSAWYAPGKEGQNKNVSAMFRRPETDCNIETVQNLTLSEHEPAIQYVAKITPRTGKIFETTLEIPENWKVLNVLDHTGQPLDFRSQYSEKSSEKHSEKSSDKLSDKLSGKIIVRFSRGFVAGESVQFSLHAVGSVKDWFQNDAEKSLQYPVIRINDSTNEQGNIFVRNQFEDDWEIIPFQMEHLIALNESLSFRYSSTPFVLELRLKKSQPRIKAGTVAFYRFEPELLRIRYEIGYFIEQSSVRRLTFLLPAHTTSTPFIQGLNGLDVKETMSEETEINGQKFRRWNILFAKPMSGTVRLGVDLEQPITETISNNTVTSFDLPPIIAENVAWQSGFVAIEGDEELDLTIPTDRNGKSVLRSVDAGEVSSAVYRPGKRLLGVYSVLDETTPIIVQVRKNSTNELVSALIRHVSVTARINYFTDSHSHAGVLYSILYEIQTAGGISNIKTTLDQSDELWSVMLDGETVKPQRVGNDILIPISARKNSDFRRLVLLYRRQPLAIDVSKRSLILDFPTLSLTGKNENETIPVMQTTWDVIPPSGYKIDQLGGSVLQQHEPLLPEPSLPEPALFQLFRGTVGFFAALTSRPSDLLNFGCSAQRKLAGIPVPISPYFQDSAGIPVPIFPYFQNRYSDENETFPKFVRGIPATAIPSDKSDGNFIGGTGSVEPVHQNRFTSSETLDLNSNAVVSNDRVYNKNDKSNDVQRENSMTDDPWNLSKQGTDRFASPAISESDNNFSKLSEQRKERYTALHRLQSIQPVSIIVSETETAGISGGYSVIGNHDAQKIFVRISSIADMQRWGLLAFLIVVVSGLFGIAQSRKRRTRFVFGLLFLGTILIFVPGLEFLATVFNGIVYGAALIGVIYLADVLRLKIVSIMTKPKIPADVAISVLLIALLCSMVHAEEQNEKLPKIVFPDKAIIVPYSPDKISENTLPVADELTSPEQSLLVPYRQYVEMLELLRNRNTVTENNQNVQNVQKFAVPFAVSASEYQTTLPSGGDDILLHGKIQIDVFTDQAVLVPLTLENGVFEQPTLDGKPASLHSTMNRQTVVLVTGTGRHELLFGIRMRIQRQGGWRIVAGKLPLAATSKVLLTLPEESGDLLTGNPLDKKKWSFGTKNQEKIIETTPELNGAFHWRWRSAVSEDNVDRNLEVDSVIRYNIQEDGVWIHWTPTFRISRGKWEMIRLKLPNDYLIAEINGENVRGWNIVQEDSSLRTIDVELLKPAEKTETLSVLLSAPQSFVKPTMNLTLPKLIIPDAGIHRGRIDLFHSSILSLRILESTGLLPTDMTNGAASKPLSKFDTISPLGSSPFRSYRFSSESHSLQIEWKHVTENRCIHFLSVLKITRQDVSLETKIKIDSNNKPFYAAIQLPEKFVLKNVNAPDGIIWNRESDNNAENRLNIISGDGRSERVEILIDGDFSGAFSKNRNEIEMLPVFRAENVYIATMIAVLTEPSLDVRADLLKNFSTLSLDSVFSWLSLPEQRELVRVVLQSGSKEMSGKLVLSERKPEVRCSTITNVRTTAEAIEETILLDFDITKAGVRNIEFVLPGWMGNAKMNAPLLRRKIITPLDTKNSDSLVLVRLELREEVLEQFRVLVQADQRLQTEIDYNVSVPIIKTGQTARQYIVMENDRRSPDEMVVLQLQNLHALNRQQSEWSYLASVLGGNVTEAYFATKNENSGKDGNDAGLSFRMRRRETVRLADARIDLAETRLTFGENGAYLAEQIYRIDNKKEPYLDLLLPVDASLWGARILTATEWQQKEQGEKMNNKGYPVKPCAMPLEIANRYPKVKGATESRLIRIPLIKTESGDPDFIVRLIYAGTLQKFSDFARIEMPFVEVLNIPVGESLVRLNLPNRYEYRFDGNLRRVQQEQESEIVRQVQSNYQRQQTDRLQKVAKGLNPFASKRAKMNLKQWDKSGTLADGQASTSQTTLTGSGSLQKSGEGTLALNGGGIISAPTQTPVSDGSDIVTEDVSFTSNVATLNSNFYSQSNKSSGNIVSQQALSINADETVKQSESSRSSSFNDRWFASNSLSNPNTATGTGGAIDVNNKVVDQKSVPILNKIPYQNAPQAESSPSQFISQQQDAVPQQQAMPQQQVMPQQQRSAEIVKGKIVLGEAGQINQLHTQTSPSLPKPTMTEPLTMSAPASQIVQVPGDNLTVGQSSPDMPQGQPSVFLAEDRVTFPLQPPPVNTNLSGNNTMTLGLPITDALLQNSSNYNQEHKTATQSAQPASSSRMSNSSGETISEQIMRVKQGVSVGGKIDGSGTLVTDQQREQSGELNGSNYSGGQTVIASGRLSRPEKDSSVIIISEESASQQEKSNDSESSETEQTLPGLSTRTASLDIEIPQTGKTFLFTIPQGSLDLSFRTISEQTESRAFQAVLAFLGLAFLYGIYRLCFGIGSRLTFDRRTHRNIAGLVTLFCVLSLLLAPFVSVLALLLAAVLWTTLFRRKQTET
ncbi:MAG: hypothetical protein LBQ50_03830 [Planctomycetaceae bacterium]|jgi:hypothetical protein|nr:hypothetical protein [Planctomycetaceae bacterium]